MPNNYNSAPNTINQDDLGTQFQDLKITTPRVWQAITSLKSLMAPMPFYAEVILPGVQAVGTDVLDHPVILKLPVDPYGVWAITSVLIQEIVVACKIRPTSSDYIADILGSRDKGQNYVSIFNSNSKKAYLKANGDFRTVIGPTELGANEAFDGDMVRIDIIQADGTVSGVWILIRGYANLKKLKRKQP